MSPPLLRALAEDLCRRTLDDPAASREALASVLEAAEPFHNRVTPVSPVPVAVRADFVRRVAPLAEEYTRLLGTVVALFRSDERIRKWFDVGEAGERLVRAEDDPSGPLVCRLDGYVEASSGRLRVLENNADAPAGTLFTPRINAAVARVRRRLDGEAAPVPGGFTDQDRFLDLLLAQGPGPVAVLQPEGGANRESRELVRRLCSRGTEAFLADPRTLTVEAGRARFAGRAAAVCWNKVNTVAWRGLTADADFTAVWERAVRDSDLRHCNGFAARYVAESKLALAFVQEPAFAAHFTERQRSIVHKLLPWTRKLDDPADAERAVAEREHFVLKAPYDIRGDGVTIGYDTPPGEWRSAVAEAKARGHVLQRRVRPASYPVPDADLRRVQEMTVSLDSYVFDGEFAGFGSKAGDRPKVNVFQGGRKTAVLVYE